MTLAWPTKDPDEVLDYSIDWSLRLGSDTIATSVFTVVAGAVAINSQSNSATQATAWLSGGLAGATNLIRSRIVTAAGRTMEQTLRLRTRSL